MLVFASAALSSKHWVFLIDLAFYLVVPAQHYVSMEREFIRQPSHPSRNDLHIKQLTLTVTAYDDFQLCLTV